MNLYGYTTNNPITLIDPYGLLKRKEVVEGGAVYSCTLWVDRYQTCRGVENCGKWLWRESCSIRKIQTMTLLIPFLCPNLSCLTYVLGTVLLKPNILTRNPVEQAQIALDIAYELEPFF